MPLINRFTRLFTADVNAVLDRIEEPDVLLRQAVRDMEHELDTMRSRERALQQEREHAADAEIREQDQLRALDEELDICFAAGEDQLARNLVRRKLEASRREQAAAARRATADKRADALETSIRDAAEQLRAMREKLEVLVDDPGRAAGTFETAIASEEIEIAYLREKQRRARS